MPGAPEVTPASPPSRGLAAIDTDTLVVAAAPECDALPRCTSVAVADSPRALELARNDQRRVWLAAVDDFIRLRLARPITPAGAAASQPAAAPIAFP